MKKKWNETDNTKKKKKICAKSEGKYLGKWTTVTNITVLESGHGFNSGYRGDLHTVLVIV